MRRIQKLLILIFLLLTVVLSAQDAGLGSPSESDVIIRDAGSGANEAVFGDSTDSPRLPDERSISLAEDAQNPDGPQPVSAFGSIFRMLLALALVAGAIYGLVLFIKRKSRPSVDEDALLRVLATTHLGSNRFVHVVSLGTKAWLLGASDGGISLLGEVEDTELIDTLRIEASRTTANKGAVGGMDFRKLFMKLGGAKDSLDAGSFPGSDALRERRERLKKL